MPTVTVSPRGEQRIRAGHPWIYRADVTGVDAAGGDVVAVIGPRARHIGTALFSDRSQIAVRMLTLGEPGEVAAVVRARLERAIAFRASLALDATAYRLVHGEADLLPSLVVDRYADYLVLQTLSQGMDRLLPVIVEALADLLRPAGILARNDPKVRTLEGLAQRVDVLAGDIPATVAVREGPVEYAVDLRHGQKTGLFLDQRENREAAAHYARGRLLDCFSYHGGFALRLAPQCESAEAVDISADAVARITANAARNGVATLQAREANVFDELRRLERAGARYETIVLDPPAFAKNKASVAERRRRLQGHQPSRHAPARPGRRPRDVQLLVQHQRRHLRGHPARGVDRQPRADDGGREAHAGPRPSGADGRARDPLPEVLHPAPSRVGASPLEP